MATTNGTDNTTKKSAGSGPATTPETPQALAREILAIPVAKIRWTWDWNIRPYSETVDQVPAKPEQSLAGYDPERESTGFGGGEKAEPGLVEDIREHTQLKPIEVRSNPDPKTRDAQPFVPVDGYRRGAAILAIAKMGIDAKDFHPIKGDPAWDARSPTILATIRPMTEYEARLRNINAGTTAKGLRTCDLSWGIAELVREAKREGKPHTDGAIALSVGKSEHHVGRLRLISDRLPKRITKHWRDCGPIILAGQSCVATAPAPFAAMSELASDAAEMAEGEIEAAYARILQNKKFDKRNLPVEARKLEAATRKAKHLGEIVAFLAYEGIDPQRVTKGQWQVIVEELVQFDRGNDRQPTEKQFELLRSTLAESYKAEMRRLANPEDGEEEEDEEGAEKKRAKRDGGR